MDTQQQETERDEARALETIYNRVYNRQPTYNRETGRVNERGILTQERLRSIYAVARLLGGKSLASFRRSLETVDRYEAILYPDGADLSLCWEGAGMFGGFIFHQYTREWSIHT